MEPVTLRVSDLPLSSIWAQLSKPGVEDVDASVGGQPKVPIQFRILPDPVDLAVARNISTTISPETGGDGGLSLSKKLERLSHDWGVVPVFTMAGTKGRELIMSSLH